MPILTPVLYSWLVMTCAAALDFVARPLVYTYQSNGTNLAEKRSQSLVPVSLHS